MCDATRTLYDEKGVNVNSVVKRGNQTSWGRVGKH